MLGCAAVNMPGLTRDALDVVPNQLTNDLRGCGVLLVTNALEHGLLPWVDQNRKPRCPGFLSHMSCLGMHI